VSDHKDNLQDEDKIEVHFAVPVVFQPVEHNSKPKTSLYSLKFQGKEAQLVRDFLALKQ
jgi:hypothetical protein